ncbi:MAG TPA: DsbA family protein [Steroidobacteraceae bacterium]|nr:DsbA family protein [Steroidobacteraceae bacterium]
MPPRRLSRACRAALGAALLGASAVALAPLAIADPEPQSVQLRLAGDEQSLGRADAPLTVVEFTDYQCPYCRRFQIETFPQLKRRYIDTGKVRFIVRDLPLPFHAAAQPAAEAAHCAGEQGRFWPMHAALLVRAADLSSSGLERDARLLNLDVKRFDACLASRKYAAAIAHNLEEADALGLSGTPSFIIGTTVNGVLTGERVAGALPFEEFAALLRARLGGS